MLKYLHTGEKRRDEIAEAFGISERALAVDLNILQDNFEFMGSKMTIHKLNRKKNTYHSLIHPIFLAMNSGEIYAMTIGLKLLSRGTVFEDSMGRIADEIYKQLSGYAKDMVDKHTEETKIRFVDDDLRFINSYEEQRKYDRPFTYFLKESIPCSVTYKDNEKEVVISGTLHLSEKSAPHYNKLIVQTENRKREIHIDDVIRITKIIK